MILTAKHPDLNNEKSYLSTAVAAGATSTPLKSAVGIAVDNYIVIGNPGQEKTEIVLLTGKSGNTVSHAALAFGHSVDAPVFVIKYNKVRFYESDTATGTYTLVTTVDLDIDNDQTKYDYTAGSEDKYYKAAYYNAELDIESTMSDPLVGSGYTPLSVAKMIEGVRTLVGEVPTDDEIISLLNLAEQTVYDYRDKWYFAKERKTYNVTADTSRYPLPTDFKMSSREVYNDQRFYDEDDVEITTSRIVSPLQRRDYNAYMTDYFLADPSDTIAIYTIDEASEELIISPTPITTNGTIEFGYWAGPSILREYTDVTKVPSVKFHVFFTASKIEASKKNTEQSKLYWNESQDALRSLGNKRYSGNQSFGVA